MLNLVLRSPPLGIPPRQEVASSLPVQGNFCAPQLDNGHFRLGLGALNCLPKLTILAALGLLSFGHPSTERAIGYARVGARWRQIIAIGDGLEQSPHLSRSYFQGWPAASAL